MAIRPQGDKTAEGLEVNPVLVRHCCRVCGARWFEKTIVRDQKNQIIYPATLEYAAYQETVGKGEGE